MNEKIVYRKYKTSDSKILAEIIRKTWNYDRFCSAGIAKQMAKLYLYSCLCNQTFTCVAEIDGIVAGIIMGKNIKKHRCPLSFRVRQLSALLSLALRNEGRETMKMFGGIDGLDEKMLKQIGRIYSGELSFFAIDESCRGLGIGRCLFEKLEGYMKEESIDDFYLYTDTSCNYHFYEHMGMNRRDQEIYSVNVNGKSEEMTFFVYDCKIE